MYSALTTSSQEYILRCCAHDEIHQPPLEPGHACLAWPSPGPCLYIPTPSVFKSHEKLVS